jgi:hypothetical protein
MIAILGCKHGEKTSGDEPLPEDLQFVFGVEGAFAGRGMGYIIHRSGEVIRWEGKYPGEVIEATAVVDAAQVRRLWKMAEEIGFLKMSEQVMATVNTFITVTAGGESSRVTWVERDENALTPAQKFYDECVVVARTALGEDEG